MTVILRAVLMGLVAGLIVGFLVRRDKLSVATLKGALIGLGMGIVVAVGLKLIDARGQGQAEELARERLAAHTVRTLTVNLIVEDVNRSLRFWRDQLDFDVTMTVPKTGSLNWAQIESGDAVLMLQQRDNLLEERPDWRGLDPPGPLLLYMDVGDLHALHDRLEEAGHEPGEIFETFYGAREFHLLGPDSLHLVFAEQQQVEPDLTD